MNRKVSKTPIKQILKQIINYPVNQFKQLNKESSNDYKRQVNCLEASNKMLSEQLSAQIQKRECLAGLLTQERNKTQQLTRQLLKTPNLFKQAQKSQRMVSRSDHSSQIFRKNSARLLTDKKQSYLERENKQLRELLRKCQTYQQQVEQTLAQSEQQSKSSKQRLLFMEQHFKRNLEEKMQLEGDYEQVLAKLGETKQLLQRQNKQILKLSIELQRLKRQSSDNSITLTLPDIEQNCAQSGDDFGKKLSEFLNQKPSQGKVCFELIDKDPQRRKIRYLKRDVVN